MKSLAPIRVCFVIDRLSRAGTESQLLALIAHIDRSKVLPHLVLLDGNDAESQALEPPDCPLLRLGLRKLFGGRTLPEAGRLTSFWRKHHIDIVQTYFLDSTYFALPLAKAMGVARVVRVRNNAGHWLTPWHRRIGKWIGRLADLTLTNSEVGRQKLIEAEGLSAAKIALLENGVDIDAMPEPNPPRTDGSIVRIGTVANLRPVKNINGLIRTAATLVKRYPRLQFEVAGEGEQRPELAKQIAASGLGERFRLCGSVANVPEFLAGIDIAVLPSHSEGMSNALLEYMAAGRAIVATDVGANARLIDHGREGLIVPPNNDVALAAAIERLLLAPDLASECGREARKRAVRDFGRQAMCRRFEEFYLNLIGRRNEPQMQKH